MKKIIFSVLFVPLLSAAQKIEIKPIVDKLTNDTNYAVPNVFIVGKQAALYLKPTLRFSVMKTKDLFAIFFNGRTYGQDIFRLNKGDSIQIRFSDNSILGFKYAETTVSDYPIGGQEFTYFDNTIVLDDDSYEILKTKEPVFIRFHHSKGYVDYDIDDKDRDKIKQALELYSNVEN